MRPRRPASRAILVTLVAEVSRKLEYVPGGGFAKLQHELSIGE